MAQPAALAQEREALRRPHTEQDQLPPLVEDPLAGEPLGLDAPAQLDRLGRGLEVEARRELHAAQHAQRIFGELLGRVAQHAIAQIGDAAERIEELVRLGIERDRVDREIPPRGRIARIHVWVRVDLEAPMTESALRLAAWQRHVDRGVAQADHAERFADQIDSELRREQSDEPVRFDPVDLDVEIARGVAEQRVANAAADESCATTGVAHQATQRIESRARLDVLDA